MPDAFGCNRQWRRHARSAGIGLAGLIVGSAALAIGAARFDVFPDQTPVPEAELADMRGGLKMPGMKGITVHFGFDFKTSVQVPDLSDLGDKITQAFVPVPDNAKANASSTGSAEVVARTKVRFNDPKRASIKTKQIIKHNGTKVDHSLTKRKADLTRETVTLNVGDPSKAAVTHVLDARQVTTIMQSVIANANLRTHDRMRLTFDGVSDFQNRLPSKAVRGSIDNLQEALTRLR